MLAFINFSELDSARFPFFRDLQKSEGR